MNIRNIFFLLVTGFAILFPSSSFAANNPVGFNVHLHQRFPASTYEETTDEIADEGFKWAREEFTWSTIEAEDDAFDFSRYDAVIDAYQNADMKVLGLLTYSATWSSTDSSDGYEFYPPQEDEWREYVRTVVAHYEGQVDHWEIWNEPNDAHFWRGSDEEYAEILLAAYEEIKDVNSDAKVIMGGTAGVDSAFFRTICTALDGAKAFDIVGVHQYRENEGSVTYSPEAMENGLDSLLAQLWGFRRAVTDCTGKNTAIWITEFGWPTNETGATGVSEKRQRNYMMRYITQAMTVPGVKKAFVYEWKDSGDEATDHEDHFGVVNRDGDHKKAVAGLALINKQLHKAEFKKVHHLKNDLEDVVVDGADWSITHKENATGALSFEDDVVEFSYDFTSADNSYVTAEMQGIAGEKKQLAFEVRAEGGPEMLRIRVEDAEGETFQYTVGTVMEEWATVFLPLTTSYYTSWGGDEDGKIDMPLQAVSFVADDKDHAPQVSGTIYLKNIQMIGNPAVFAYKFKKRNRLMIIAWATKSKLVKFRSVRWGSHKFVRLAGTAVKDKNKYFTRRLRPALQIIRPPKK